VSGAGNRKAAGHGSGRGGEIELAFPGHDVLVRASGYESWFISARDPLAPRALWIRHTRLRPVAGPESAALWCTVVDHDLSERPVVIKEVFGAVPASASAAPGRFSGAAAMEGQTARWDLTISRQSAPLRPLRPAVLYRAPLPRTKLEATVPDGQVTGTLAVNGHQVEVNQWRGTVGHNWGTEHADRWVWLHAAAPHGWLELVLARIKVGPVHSPWTAMGALSLGDELRPLGGLGRRPTVSSSPRHLTASVSAPGGQVEITVTVTQDDAATVTYADPGGGTRFVTHAALATVQLKLPRHRQLDLTMAGAYEYGTSRPLPGFLPRPLPNG
jgi:hypothetical protein